MLALIIMSALLGASSFLCGIIPLSFALSKHHISRFSTFGSGILIGTALGVIIPEGIDALAEANPTQKLPTNQIALSLIVGFCFMLIIEQLVAPGAHSHGGVDLPLHSVNGDGASRLSPHTVEFDAGDLEPGAPDPAGSGFMQVDIVATEDARHSKARAYPLTFGLVVHALADGLALGVSSVSPSSPGADGTHDLSLIVFFALIIHKAPTSLALTTALLNTSLHPRDCRKHLAIFAASTPVGAILSYLFLSFFSAGATQASWTGIALLLSGGTFLYVATVLQPVSHSHSTDEGVERDMTAAVRVLLIATGMITPYLIGHVLLPDVH
ncbi:Beta-lactamase class penicillin binding protein [Mycena kentingensis (nom. inval.)]|nr:Beta-lactamase class penicillin binding protein [Mycena kentingensis (nom. inval.)]